MSGNFKYSQWLLFYGSENISSHTCRMGRKTRLSVHRKNEEVKKEMKVAEKDDAEHKAISPFVVSVPVELYRLARAASLGVLRDRIKALLAIPQGIIYLSIVSVPRV